ncbi:MAG: hydroxyacylglutathione hydrolase [Thermoleophilia bacterium]|nr:hydroxyacylglutathione hydrolase [Thermoleophilia bacterium]
MTIEITGKVQYEAWQERIFPPAERLGDGLWSVPVVFPRNPMRYTLCYVLADGDQCIVVDPGFDSREGYLQLLDGLRMAGVGPTEVSGIIATHFHTDHLGMARRLAKVSGAPIAMGASERRYISDYRDVDVEVDADRKRMRKWGVPEERVPEGAMTAAGLQHLRELADPDFRLTDGDLVPFSSGAMRVVETPGHTPGHICFEVPELQIFISGDHVLPRISPNVSLELRGDADPLGSYLNSLELIESNDNYEVLPAHEYRFRGLSRRARQLRALATERSLQVMETVTAQTDPTVYSVARDVSWSRGFESLQGLQFRLALSETAAHLQYLTKRGFVGRIEGLTVHNSALPANGFSPI